MKPAQGIRSAMDRIEAGDMDKVIALWKAGNQDGASKEFDAVISLANKGIPSKEHIKVYEALMLADKVLKQK